MEQLEKKKYRDNLQVRQLQKDLATCGFNPGPLDGIWGPRTLKAVKELQNYCRLQPDGIVGTLTLQALKLLLPHKPQVGQRLSSHFQGKEFTCRCCGQLQINIYLLEILEKLRTQLGNKPIIISSGFRCSQHNLKVGGAKNSQHLKGSAADIIVKGIAPKQTATAAERLNFPGVGRYSSFTHVDVRPGKAARWQG